MSNKYLEKIAGLPGSFITAARKTSVDGMMNNTAKAAHSGLSVGMNVSPSKSLTPRVVQNRTGMSRSSLINKID